MNKVLEGKDPLVREEQGFAATSLQVVWLGTAGQPRESGFRLKASKPEATLEKKHLLALIEDEFDRTGV